MTANGSGRMWMKNRLGNLGRTPPRRGYERDWTWLLGWGLSVIVVAAAVLLLLLSAECLSCSAGCWERSTMHLCTCRYVSDVVQHQQTIQVSCDLDWWLLEVLTSCPCSCMKLGRATDPPPSESHTHSKWCYLRCALHSRGIPVNGGTNGNTSYLRKLIGQHRRMWRRKAAGKVFVYGSLLRAKTKCLYVCISITARVLESYGRAGKAAIYERWSSKCNHRRRYANAMQEENKKINADIMEMP